MSRFTTRSTQQDSFLPFSKSYKPRAAIYPVEAKYEYTKFDHISTQQAAYVSHTVQPYVAAKKPPPSMGPNGFA